MAAEQLPVGRPPGETVGFIDGVSVEIGVGVGLGPGVARTGEVRLTPVNEYVAWEEPPHGRARHDHGTAEVADATSLGTNARRRVTMRKALSAPCDTRVPSSAALPPADAMANDGVGVGDEGAARPDHIPKRDTDAGRGRDTSSAQAGSAAAVAGDAAAGGDRDGASTASLDDLKEARSRLFVARGRMMKQKSAEDVLSRRPGAGGGPSRGEKAQVFSASFWANPQSSADTLPGSDAVSPSFARGSRASLVDDIVDEGESGDAVGSASQDVAASGRAVPPGGAAVVASRAGVFSDAFWAGRGEGEHVNPSPSVRPSGIHGTEEGTTEATIAATFARFRRAMRSKLLGPGQGRHGTEPAAITASGGRALGGAGAAPDDAGGLPRRPQRALSAPSVSMSSALSGVDLEAEHTHAVASLTALLAPLRLAQFVRPLIDLGASDVEDLTELEEADLVGMGMKPLQCRRLLRAIARISEEKASLIAESPRSTASSTPVAPSPVATTPYAARPIAMISPDELTNREVIGAGGFGRVFRALYDAAPVAMKKLQTASVDQLLAEATRLAAVSGHAHVVTLYGICEDKDCLWIVTEFAANGSLEAYMQRHVVPLVDRVRMVKEAASACVHLHRNMVIHRDLAPRNMLLDAATSVKLCDFGLSRVMAGSATEQITATPFGPLSHMAPESALFSVYSRKSDVFMLGICAWEVLTAQRAFAEQPDATRAAIAILRGLRPSLESVRALGSKAVTELALPMLERCWAEVPQNRPAMREVYEVFAVCEASVRAEQRAAEATGR